MPEFLAGPAAGPAGFDIQCRAAIRRATRADWLETRVHGISTL